MKKERIPPDQIQSFRLFSWEDNKEEVWVDHGDGEPVREIGVGRSWHYHPEIELTMITSGEGTRYVGDDVSLFHGPELVLLGRNLNSHIFVLKSRLFWWGVWIVKFPLSTPALNVGRSFWWWIDVGSSVSPG